MQAIRWFRPEARAKRRIKLQTAICLKTHKRRVRGRVRLWLHSERWDQLLCLWHQNQYNELSHASHKVVPPGSHWDKAHKTQTGICLKTHKRRVRSRKSLVAGTLPQRSEDSSECNGEFSAKAPVLYTHKRMIFALNKVVPPESHCNKSA